MTAPSATASALSLSTRDGVLVSVTIPIEPRRLERLLEALARVDFPINPEIYHQAELVYRSPEGREETEPITLVVFPAFASRLDEVRRALEAYNFDPTGIQVTGMLDELRSEFHEEAAGSRRQCRVRRQLS